MDCSDSSTHVNLSSTSINDDEFNRPSTSKQFNCNVDVNNKNASPSRNVNYNIDDMVILSSDDSDVILSENDDVCFIENCEPDVNISHVIDSSRLEEIVKDKVELELLFKNQLMEPLTFLLLLHDFMLEIKLTRLIEDCGGVVYKSVLEIDSYTAVMVKDDSLHWMYLGPVFKVSYIQACIESSRILDISCFFKSSTKLILKKNFNYMGVIYLKKYSWDSIPEKFLLKKPDGYSEKVCSKMNQSSEIISDSSGDEENDKRKNTQPCPNKLINKHTRMLYSRKEDEDILKYIVKHKGYDNIKGNALWKTLENKKVCPTRTWQSIKERFLKKIVYSLNSYNFLTDKEIKLLQVCAFRK